MNPGFREILELLNKHEVEYIVVGGVAAVIQGAPITTFDLDALVRISDDNASGTSLALDELDAADSSRGRWMCWVLLVTKTDTKIWCTCLRK